MVPKATVMAEQALKAFDERFPDEDSVDVMQAMKKLDHTNRRLIDDLGEAGRQVETLQTALTSREEQVMSLCSIAGVEAEEGLEERVRDLVAAVTEPAGGQDKA